MKILPGVYDLWSGHEIEGSNLWPSVVTLTFSPHALAVWSAHPPAEAIIWQQSNEILSKGYRDTERARKCYGRTDEGHSYSTTSVLLQEEVDLKMISRDRRAYAYSVRISRCLRCICYSFFTWLLCCCCSDLASWNLQLPQFSATYRVISRHRFVFLSFSFYMQQLSLASV